MEEVKLHGFWYSPFTMRMAWALKLKGIAYENIEEDRFDKSPQLLQYNPIYKKTPVLVHAGRPIWESMIIVEYIDELCPQNALVPADPYERAQARFWVRYADQMIDAVAALYMANGGEELEKGIETARKHFRVVEDRCLIDQSKFFGGDTINVVDIAFGSLFTVIVTMEDMHEVKIQIAEKFPRLHSWFDNFKDDPIIKDYREKMYVGIKPNREKMLASS